MARPAYQAEKARLEQDVLEMVSRVEAMVVKSVDALASLDTTMAMEVMRSDDEIDRQDIEIEQACLRMLALQQPMASDLREIGTVLKIITDIERIGDLSVDLAKITLKIDAEMGSTNYVDIPQMAVHARAMLRNSIQAFVQRDTAFLAEIASAEETVDGLYRELRSQIHDYMRAQPSQVVAASWMLLAVHHLERIADHAVNIAERVGFMVTGELKQLSRDIPANRPETGDSL